MLYHTLFLCKHILFSVAVPTVLVDIVLCCCSPYCCGMIADQLTSVSLVTVPDIWHGFSLLQAIVRPLYPCPGPGGGEIREGR